MMTNEDIERNKQRPKQTSISEDIEEALDLAQDYYESADSYYGAEGVAKSDLYRIIKGLESAKKLL